MPCEILGMSMGMVNRTMNTDLNRMRDRLMIQASRKEIVTEMTVAITVVKNEFVSMGTNCGE